MEARKLVTPGLWVGSVIAAAFLVAAGLGRSGDLEVLTPHHTAPDLPAERAELSAEGSPLGGRARVVVPGEADRAPQGQADRTTGEVDVLAIAGSEQADGTRWILRSTDNRRSLSLIAGHPTPVHVGRWEVHGEDDQQWRATSKFVEVEEGERSVVWVAHIYKVDLRITDVQGAALQGVSVYWDTHPPEDPRDLDANPPSPLEPAGVTDEDGTFQLAGVSSVAGDLRVTAPGFRPKTLYLSGTTDRSIELRLSPRMPGEQSIQLRSFPDDLPVKGVSIYDSHGILLGTSDDTGTIQLPTWIGDRDSLSLAGGGTLPVSFLGEDLGPENSIVLRSIQRLHVQPSTRMRAGLTVQPPVSCLIDLKGWPNEVLGRPLTGLLRSTVVSDGQHLMLPRDIPCVVRASDALGRESTDRHLIPAANGELILALGPADSGLSISVEFQALEARAFRVEAELRRGNTWLGVSPPGSALVMPWPDEVHSFQVSAEQCAPVRLFSRPSPVRAGSVSVTLSRAWPVTFEVKDPDGRALRGMELSITAEDTSPRGVLTNSRGETESGNPAWYIAEPSIRSRITGSDGRARFPALAAGRYLLWPKRPSQVDGNRGRLTLDSLRPIPFLVGAHDAADSHAATVRVTLPRFSRIAVFAVDEASGIELDSFSLSSTSGMPNQTVRVEGPLWEGWVPAETDTLIVSAPGYHDAHVGMGRLTDGTLQQVQLSPAASCTLKLLGDLVPQEVEVQFVRESVGLRGNRWESVVETRTVPVVDGVVHLRYRAASERMFARLLARAPGGMRILLTPEELDLAKAEATVLTSIAPVGHK